MSELINEQAEKIREVAQTTLDKERKPSRHDGVPEVEGKGGFAASARPILLRRK